MLKIILYARFNQTLIILDTYLNSTPKFNFNVFNQYD